MGTPFQNFRYEQKILIENRTVKLGHRYKPDSQARSRLDLLPQSLLALLLCVEQTTYGNVVSFSGLYRTSHTIRARIVRFLAPVVRSTDIIGMLLEPQGLRLSSHLDDDVVTIWRHRLQHRTRAKTLCTHISAEMGRLCGHENDRNEDEGVSFRSRTEPCGEESLALACASPTIMDDPQLVVDLVAMGARMNHPPKEINRYWTSPLEWCVEQDKPLMMKVLLDLGAIMTCSHLDPERARTNLLVACYQKSRIQCGILFAGSRLQKHAELLGTS